VSTWTHHIGAIVIALASGCATAAAPGLNLAAATAPAPTEVRSEPEERAPRASADVVDFTDESEAADEIHASAPPPREYETLLPERFRRPSGR